MGDTIPPLDRRNKILAENEHFSQTRYDPSLPDLRELVKAPETDVAALFTPPPVRPSTPPLYCFQIKWTGDRPSFSSTSLYFSAPTINNWRFLQFFYSVYRDMMALNEKVQLVLCNWDVLECDLLCWFAQYKGCNIKNLFFQKLRCWFHRNG